MKHVFQHLIYPLYLPISLRMVSSAEVQICTQICKQPLSKIGSELGIYVKDYCLWKSMQFENILHEDLCNVISLMLRLHQYEMSAFVNLSTTTMMESCCLKVIGNPVIKSMEITSHFHSGTGKGDNKPAGY